MATLQAESGQMIYEYKEIMQRKRNQCCFEDSPHPIVDNIMSYDVTDAL
jgi:DNA helicase IV